MKKILFDSDVIIDVLTQRQPFLLHSIQALDIAANSPTIKAYVAAHAITNIFYIVRRPLGTTEALIVIKHLLQKIEVASVNDLIIRNALKANMKDFEDAVTMKTAETINAEMIITRNLKDYEKSTVPAVSPTMFLQIN